MPTVLSIQSSVAFGHVGNSAAVFPLMRMGLEVWPVHTVQFSNHTGYGSWRGTVMAASDVMEVVRGIDDRGALGEVDAVLSGYQGAEDTGVAILDAVALVRQRNPAAIYCCDPVLGDVGRGLYVGEAIPALMRDRVVPAAQIVTPNQFELGALTGLPTATLPQVLAAAQATRALGPEMVLVTSVVASGDVPATMQLVAVAGHGAWAVTTPLLPRTFTGAGDLAAATFLAAVLTAEDLPSALAHTAAVVFSVLAATHAAGRSELALVAAQDELVRPTHRFRAVQLG